LTPLEEKFPDHAHRSEVEGFRRLYEDYQAEREAELQAQRGGPLSEARWFFYQGLRLQRGGDEAGAHPGWKALIEGYGQVPAARPWVRRAERGLAGRDEPDSSLDGLREALKRAQRLRDEGRAEEADAIRRSLEDLYRDDPAGRKLLGEEK